jgi:hypothetical protein
LVAEAGERLRDEVTPLMITAVPEAGRAYVVGAEPAEETVIVPPGVRVWDPITKADVELAEMVEEPTTRYGVGAGVAWTFTFWMFCVAPLMITADPVLGRTYVVGAEPAPVFMTVSLKYTGIPHVYVVLYMICLQLLQLRNNTPFPKKIILDQLVIIVSLSRLL